MNNKSKTVAAVIGGLAAALVGAAVGNKWKSDDVRPEVATRVQLVDGGVVDLSKGPHVMRRAKTVVRSDGGVGKQEDLFRLGGMMCDRALAKQGLAPAQACWKIKP